MELRERVRFDECEGLARSTLDRGSVLAHAAARSLDRFAHCSLIDPRSPMLMQLSDPSETATTDERIDAAVGAHIGCSAGVNGVLVEDEFAMRMDPNVQPCAFIDERVVRWGDPAADLLDCARLLRPGRRGVPLCGYLLDRRLEDVGVRDDEEFTAPLVASLFESMTGLVIPLLDGEAVIVMRLNTP